MKRVLALSIAALTGLMAATASAESNSTATASFSVPRKHLTRGVASYAVRTMVYRQFGTAHGDSFSQNQGSIDCKRRLSAKRRRCTFGWFIGDSGYGGQAKVRQKTERNGGDVRVIVDWRILHVDEYCFFVLENPASECKDTTSGRAVIDGVFEARQERAH